MLFNPSQSSTIEKVLINMYLEGNLMRVVRWKIWQTLIGAKTTWNLKVKSSSLQCNIVFYSSVFLFLKLNYLKKTNCNFSFFLMSRLHFIAFTTIRNVKCNEDAQSDFRLGAVHKFFSDLKVPSCNKFFY